MKSDRHQFPSGNEWREWTSVRHLYQGRAVLLCKDVGNDTLTLPTRRAQFLRFFPNPHCMFIFGEFERWCEEPPLRGSAYCALHAAACKAKRVK